ncbi:hypothetical protein [Streptomyces sp. NPDC048002]|uniref:hypothetical protein n=1 Tax=Streptomyces sp. NPDC048002 TaxID=3154344 RepID=UPI0033EAC9B1
MADTSAEPFDQLLFRWEGNQNQYVTGIAAAAYSCDAQRAEELRTLLAPLLRVEGSGSRHAGLVRCLVPGTRETVLIHRRPVHDARGRESTVSHALVGGPALLTGAEAISLAWSHWKWTNVPDDATGGLDSLPVEAVREQTRAALPRYVERVPRIAPQLEVAVAQLLRTPNHRLTFRRRDLGGPEEKGGAALLIWGLCSMLGPWLGDEVFTFASLDTQEHAGLRLVCVPEWPRSAVGGAAAQRITFDDAVRDQARTVAAHLVTLFLADPACPDRLEEVLRTCPTPSTRSLRDRLDTLTRALNGDLSGPRAAVPGGLGPAAGRLQEDPPFARPPGAPARPVGLGPLHRPVERPGPIPRSAGPAARPVGQTGSGPYGDLPPTAADVQEFERGHAPAVEAPGAGSATSPTAYEAPGAGSATSPTAYEAEALAPETSPPPEQSPERWTEPLLPADPPPDRADLAGSGTARAADGPSQPAPGSAHRQNTPPASLGGEPPPSPAAGADQSASVPRSAAGQPHRRAQEDGVAAPGRADGDELGALSGASDFYGGFPYGARGGRLTGSAQSPVTPSGSASGTPPPPSAPAQGPADRTSVHLASPLDSPAGPPAKPPPLARGTSGPRAEPAAPPLDLVQLPVRLRTLRRLGKWVSPLWYRQRQRAHEDADWVLEEMRRPDGRSSRVTTAQFADILVRMPDRDLCRALDDQALRPEHAVLILTALEKRTRWRTLTEAVHLAASLLGQRLYLHRSWRAALDADGNTRHGGTAGAVRMFRWAVQPYVREPHLKAGLLTVVRACGNEPGGEARRFWRHVAFQPADTPPDLPAAVWRELARLGPWEGPGTETPSVPAPSVPAPSEAAGPVAGHERRATGAMHRSPPDDSRKVIIALITLAVLLPVLIWWLL